MTIAYLMNQHPYGSCTFIRREIVGLEACGISVARFSIRPPETELLDIADQEEAAKTKYILSVGVVGLLLNTLKVAVANPVRFLQSLWLSLKIGWRSDRGVGVHLVYLAEACVLLRWFSNQDIWQIHAHFGTNPTTVAMLCQSLGGPPYSFTVHGPHEFDKAEFIALPEKIKRAALVIAVSFFGKSQLYRWCDYQQWSKIHIVHCGIDEIFLKMAPIPIPNQPRLVCVGRICEQKGQLLLVESARRLADLGLDFKIVLVGGGPLQGAVEASISRLGLENYFEITGWTSNKEVKEQILAAKIMVLPSFAEGLPVVIMESLALGRPVISTYVAGIPELIEEGVSGWLVPAGSVEALTEVIRLALLTPITKLEKMGNAGFQRVFNEHDSLKEAQKLAVIFESVHLNAKVNATE